MSITLTVKQMREALADCAEDDEIIVYGVIALDLPRGNIVGAKLPYDKGVFELNKKDGMVYIDVRIPLGFNLEGKFE